MYKEKREILTPVYVFVAEWLVYLPRRSNNADMAIAKMNTVIATRINAIALSNPTVIFPAWLYDALYADVSATVGVCHRDSFSVHMIKATTARAAKAIPIISTTDKSTIA